ncbi:MAG TPA: SAM-dependent methyltransferase [Albitalea sp.]|nr:SAM-dependent methyltransferase [Albitalea sp.]
MPTRPVTATLFPAETTAVPRFLELLQRSLAQGSFVKLALGKYHGADTTLQRVLVRTLALRGTTGLSFVYRHTTKDLTRNLPAAEALTAIAAAVQADFDHAHLLTSSHDVQLARSRKGVYTLRVGKLADAAAQAPPPAPHDRPKHRQLDITTPFLVELGVTDAQHRLIPQMARKWKQINKFVEVLAHALDDAGLASASALRVLDFGSGKGYLTFAVHDHLQRRGIAPDVVGIELRDDLVALCNGALQRLGLQGLRFEHGDVRSHASAGVDIMIALHACDTATDHAIHRGIASGASVILCSPCCHKQLRPQMRSPKLLAPMLQHGIHLGQQAEMVTDGLRALLLQREGYDAQVFEFVALEHTSKNKMILAVKRAPPSAAQRAALQVQIAEIKAFYGIEEQCLETLLTPPSTR